MYVEAASAYEADNVFEQIRALAQRLTLNERLQLIRDVLTMPSPPDGPQLESQIKQDETQSAEDKIEARRIRREKLKEEQLAWHIRPSYKRELYAGRYVALHEGNIVDSGTDKGALYGRIRRRFGRQPIAIIPAEQTEIQTIMIRRSPLEDQLAKK